MIELESLKIGDLAFDFKNGKSMAVDYYRKLDVDRLFFSLKHQLFKSRSIAARTRQILLKNAIIHLESKYKRRFDNLRLEFHMWGIVKRKCKKYANKLKLKI